MSNETYDYLCNFSIMSPRRGPYYAVAPNKNMYESWCRRNGFHSTDKQVVRPIIEPNDLAGLGDVNMIVFPRVLFQNLIGPQTLLAEVYTRSEVYGNEFVHLWESLEWLNRIDEIEGIQVSIRIVGDKILAKDSWNLHDVRMGWMAVPSLSDALLAHRYERIESLLESLGMRLDKLKRMPTRSEGLQKEIENATKAQSLSRQYRGRKDFRPKYDARGYVSPSTPKSRRTIEP